MVDLIQSFILSQGSGIVSDTQELSMLDLLGKVTDKTNELATELNNFKQDQSDDITSNRKLSPTGDFTGTLAGYPITSIDIGLSSIVNGHTADIDTIQDDLVTKGSVLVSHGQTLTDHTSAIAGKVDTSALTGMKSNVAPLMDGTASAGTSVNLSRDDHKHPVDTSREPAITKKTAFNKDYDAVVSNVKMDGTASLGTLDTIARTDHVHPKDSTKADKTGDTIIGLINGMRAKSSDGNGYLLFPYDNSMCLLMAVDTGAVNSYLLAFGKKTAGNIPELYVVKSNTLYLSTASVAGDQAIGGGGAGYIRTYALSVPYTY